eukprot:TRINITY_DN72611_c0_g1_i1.p1 TRINITY_DN72611_c0_g1~~TRINITY_DN72611_c0_g1_i1.p1  ORF type:complete len:366 (+),score=25.66 TRINITY_DN72611_c0_g1_i1:118-1098(+)
MEKEQKPEDLFTQVCELKRLVHQMSLKLKSQETDNTSLMTQNKCLKIEVDILKAVMAYGRLTLQELREERAEKEAVKKELEALKNQDKSLLNSAVSNLNPLEENLFIPAVSVYKKKPAKYFSQGMNNRYIKSKTFNSESIVSNLDDNELAENEVKNIPIESKCSIVHKPLSLYPLIHITTTNSQHKTYSKLQKYTEPECRSEEIRESDVPPEIELPKTGFAVKHAADHIKVPQIKKSQIDGKALLAFSAYKDKILNEIESGDNMEDVKEDRSTIVIKPRASPVVCTVLCNNLNRETQKEWDYRSQEEHHSQSQFLAKQPQGGIDST